VDVVFVVVVVVVVVVLVPTICCSHTLPSWPQQQMRLYCTSTAAAKKPAGSAS
jgi:hypothetical protein